MDKIDCDIFQSFQQYLEARRRALLAELDEIERLSGLSPRTAEIRRQFHRRRDMGPAENLAGVAGYEKG